MSKMPTKEYAHTRECLETGLEIQANRPRPNIVNNPSKIGGIISYLNDT